MAYTGTAGDDIYQGSSTDNGSTLSGLGGNDILRSYASGANRLEGGEGHDRLIGGVGDDTIYGGTGDDFMNGQDGNNFYDGGAGADTIMLLGDRGDWEFTPTTPGNGTAWSELYQIEAEYSAIETFEFVQSDGKPEYATLNTWQNNTMTGNTGVRDLFFFDTQLALKTGYDNILRFDTGDVLVLTTKLADWNGDGVTTSQYNNRYHLYDENGTSLGTVGIQNSDGVINSVYLADVETQNGVTYYKYMQTGDTYTPFTLDIL